MRIVKRFALGVLLVGSAALATAGQTGRLPSSLTASASTEDSLYVGDAADNSVKRFDAQTGQYLGAFVPTASGNLHGPRGMLHLAGEEGEGNFLVSDQNVNRSSSGEIEEYSGDGGKPLKALVPHSSPNAPFAPRGIILGPDGSTLYVADLGSGGVGAVERFDADTGQFLGDLDFSSFITNSRSNPTGEFHPRGLVFGPDGLLYVSLFSEINPPSPLGWILSYNLSTGAVTVVASNSSATACTQELHRPEGLTVGPDGNLYVTSFASSCDPVGPVDRVLIYTIGTDGTGTPAGEIDLDQAGQSRAFAQALVFGPGGSLFVPISGNGPDTGSVRTYDVSTKTFADFVLPSAQGGPLGSPWYLTFGQTNPETLAYGR
jgi:DNA-binding beta-propeller fold protein YncE